MIFTLIKKYTNKFSIALIVLFLNIFNNTLSWSQKDQLNIPKVPILHAFNSEDYKGGIQNWSIDQDNRGFIYVANNFGLLEFDGNSWSRYIIPNSTRSLSVLASNDRIYVGGPNNLGFFYHNSLQGLSYASLNHLLDESISDEIWRIEYFNNMIVFGGLTNTYIYDGTEISTIKRSGNVLFTIEKELFLYDKTIGLVRFNEEMQEKQILAPLANDMIVSVISISQDQKMLVSANGKLFTLSNNSIKRIYSRAEQFLKSAKAVCAVKAADNTIAIGTQNNGLVIVNTEGDIITRINSRMGLNSNTILCLYEDNFNNLWVGQSNGITYIELGSAFSLINNSVGITGTGYSAALFEEKLYLGTLAGLHIQQENNIMDQRMSDYFKIIPGTEGNAYQLKKIEDKLFVGHHRGAFQIKDGAIKPLYTENGAWDFLKLPENSGVIGGTYNGFIKISPDGKKISKIDGFNESSRIIKYYDDSTLWMTHGYKGVYKIHFDNEFSKIKKIDFYGDKKGFPSNLLINVFELEDNLYFPAEYGIYTFDPERNIFLNQNELENLLGSYTHVSYLVNDDEKNIYYLLGDKTAGTLEYQSFNKYIKKQNVFSKIKKYISDDLENINIIDDQNILIGAKEGFIHYNPKKEILTSPKFDTYIRKIEVLSKEDTTFYQNEINSDEEISFSSKQHSFRFSFSAPYFDGFEDIQYQTRLKNFEENWTDWAVSNTREYTNIPNGTYEFEVRAKNIYDRQSGISSFTFTIIPEWYRSRTAYAGYILIFFLSFFISILFINQRYKKETRKLELTKEREIEKKKREFEDLSSRSRETITKLKNEKLEAEVEHKNRELASSTMHLLNKNEIMLSVKNNLQKIYKNTKETEDKREIRRIIKTIDNNIADDENWDQFTKHFDQVHGDFLKNLQDTYPDLTPQELKLAAYLRMNLNTKNIAQLFNISVRGVEISRYRLRKKLNLDRSTNLASYIMNF